MIIYYLNIFIKKHLSTKLYKNHVSSGGMESGLMIKVCLV